MTTGEAHCLVQTRWKPSAAVELYLLTFRGEGLSDPGREGEERPQEAFLRDSSGEGASGEGRLTLNPHLSKALS